MLSLPQFIKKQLLFWNPKSLKFAEYGLGQGKINTSLIAQ